MSQWKAQEVLTKLCSLQRTHTARWHRNATVFLRDPRVSSRPPRCYTHTAVEDFEKKKHGVIHFKCEALILGALRLSCSETVQGTAFHVTRKDNWKFLCRTLFIRGWKSTCDARRNSNIVRQLLEQWISLLCIYNSCARKDLLTLRCTIGVYREAWSAGASCASYECSCGEWALLVVGNLCCVF